MGKGVQQQLIPDPPSQPSDPAGEPTDLTPVTVGGGSPPLEFENRGSVGGFSPKNPKKPDRTDERAISGEIF